jgi:integrase
VPLSKAALQLLKSMPRSKSQPLLFPAPRGGQLSDMTLSAVLRRMEVDVVPHGFRSSFRNWCAERTKWPREMAEMALAHRVADAVEAAYLRTDMFDKRRKLMQQWADFCARPVAAAAA